MSWKARKKADMAAREEILARLRQQQRGQPMPAAWQSKRQFDDLAAQFTQALTAVSGEVIRVNDFDEGVAALGDLLHELNAQRVVVNGERPLLEAKLPHRFPKITWHTVGQSDGDLRAFCANADVGVSSAAAALAETGSVLIESGAGKSRLATLLPPIHIVLLPTNLITTDLFTWAAARQGVPPTNMTFVSGPSKTADIEQTLAIGVHGPKRFIVILYPVMSVNQ
jgi:L-lactate dehydrogenase complex protein LldG